ncbi:probable transmembrane GTPase FZO-like, chloroplastic isoform X1 [Durio zibethinus]|uniref:Probable transmembrane GTPase FZO-like, chloroplastic isoform X1 n=1 Tax=Durio zibethinus TaxID=66656 RepID=A0A6P5ZZP1_DURZI|nr:probable transmembrane GTPase FZO-like, chloroplastic isoform X1 [Durio zibethinus]
MIPFLSLQSPASTFTPLFLFPPSPPFSSGFTKSPIRRFIPPPKSSLSNNPFNSTSQQLGPQGPQNRQPPRTLFPGGYKRPEIKVPNFVLQLDPEEVLADDNALGFIDKAVSKWIGLVVLNGGEGSGGRVYEAARSLKAVVKDRAYLLITERVDIAAAVGASGVVLSDQGLPAIVARNTMMDSKSDSVFLPLVARTVQTASAALNASSSEGADFLIYDLGEQEYVDMVMKSVYGNVKIPIFIVNSNSQAKVTSYTEGSKILKSGASGLVLSLEDLRLLTDDVLSQLFNIVSTINNKPRGESIDELKMADIDHDSHQKMGVAGFIKVEDREKQLIEKERSVLIEAINVFQKAAPLMEEISLLIDAVAQIDEPFLLAIVGEFNSGKSTVINALLGERYLKEGVVPTTNEITFLRYSELDGKDLQRCERHPDGQLICYLPAPILKEMNIVDTPGTNVILQRQQRLTEEFVPRADLLFFVISADRPLTESEVAFLRYTQQWKKKVVIVLNKADLYQNAEELEEAISFIKENTQKLLNTEDVTLYPVAARSVLEEKHSATSGVGKEYRDLSVSDSNWRTISFYKLENFLYSFLDGSTSTGVERMKLKLGTPIAIAERILSACEILNRKDCQSAEQDLTSANEIVSGVKEYVIKMENESISWRRRTLSMIDTTKSRILELVESTLQLSNLDIVALYFLKGGSSATLPATSRVQNDILGPALADAQNLLGDYVTWLQSNNAREGRLYEESFEKRWPSLAYSDKQYHLETYELLRKLDQLSLRVIENFSANAASKLFEQEVREAFLGTFGGLGAAGLSASLLTSILPTTLEDLLALGLCSAGGFIAISNFPARRQEMIEKVKKTANALARELEDAMQKDLYETTENLEKFVRIIGKPYRDAAQNRLDKLLEIKDELSNTRETLQMLQVEIQNLHVS